MDQVSVPFSSLIDRSGSITTAGAAQKVLQQNSSRRGWRLQNNSDADLYFNDTGGTAGIKAAGSYRLRAGDYYESPQASRPGFAVSVIGSKAGQAFSAGEW